VRLSLERIAQLFIAPTSGRVFPENYSTTNSQAKTIYGGRDGRGIAATAREIEAARPRE